MTKKLLTKDLVDKARKELEAADEKVTSKSIRDHLGFGSYKTAKDLLEELEAEESALEPAPAEVAAALNDSADKVWAVAREKAGEAFHAQEAVLTARAKEAEALAAERLDVIVELEESQEQLEEEQARLRKKLMEAETRFRSMRSRITELEKDLAVEKTRNATLQQLLEPAFGQSGQGGTGEAESKPV